MLKLYFHEIMSNMDNSKAASCEGCREDDMVECAAFLICVFLGPPAVVICAGILGAILESIYDGGFWLWVLAVVVGGVWWLCNFG